MRLGDGNGLDVISALKRRRPDARGIILTGYGNIATAVNAVKLGAVDYLAKPVDADDVVAALLALDNAKIEPPENPKPIFLTIRRIRISCRIWQKARRRLPVTSRISWRVISRSRETPGLIYMRPVIPLELVVCSVPQR